ncbi:MAG: S1/P1 nuclease, partial [Bryobacteraceae bacterium]
PREKRDEALRFLVHFIGDMHQPLHAGERHDKGGNDVHVTFEGHPLNLHAAWDGKLLEAWFRQDPEAEQKLKQGAPAEEREAMSAGTVDDWIWQSQAVSRDIVYAPLDRCQCSILDQAYLQQAIPAMQTQLLRAGERLGRVLNETLGQ